MRISDWSSDVCSSDLVSGQILSVAGGRVSRVVVAEPIGYYSKELTPEQVRDNWGTISSLDDLIVPDNANEEIGQLLNVVRSEERRVGKERGSTGKCRGSPDN